MVQEISARDLAITRRVSTGSWLGRRFQGQGIGTEMRAAVLHLAFTGLDAQEAASSAFADNHTSHAVSRKLGYQPNGIDRRVVQGALTIDHRLLLTMSGRPSPGTRFGAVVTTGRASLGHLRGISIVVILRR